MCNYPEESMGFFHQHQDLHPSTTEEQFQKGAKEKGEGLLLTDMWEHRHRRRAPKIIATFPNTPQLGAGMGGVSVMWFCSCSKRTWPALHYSLFALQFQAEILRSRLKEVLLLHLTTGSLVNNSTKRYKGLLLPMVKKVYLYIPDP